MKRVAKLYNPDGNRIFKLTEIDKLAAPYTKRVYDRLIEGEAAQPVKGGIMFVSGIGLRDCILKAKEDRVYKWRVNLTYLLSILIALSELLQWILKAR